MSFAKKGVGDGIEVKCHVCGLWTYRWSYEEARTVVASVGVERLTHKVGYAEALEAAKFFGLLGGEGKRDAEE